MKNKHINQVRSLLRESQNPEYGNGSIELLSALLYAARHPSKKLACVDNAIVDSIHSLLSNINKEEIRKIASEIEEGYNLKYYSSFEDLKKRYKLLTLTQVKKWKTGKNYTLSYFNREINSWIYFDFLYRGCKRRNEINKNIKYAISGIVENKELILVLGYKLLGKEDSVRLTNGWDCHEIYLVR